MVAEILIVGTALALNVELTEIWEECRERGWHQRYARLAGVAMVAGW